MNRHLPQHRIAARRTGFTLLELILAVGLTSLLMAATYGAMSAYWKLAMESHDEVRQTRIAQALLKRMARDIQSCTFAEQTEQSLDDSSTGTGSTAAGLASMSGSNVGPGFDSGAQTDSGSNSTLTEATTNPWKNGLIGTSQDLILYTSSPDRDLNYVSAPEAVGATSRNSDLLIVRWLLAQSGSGTLAGAMFDEHSDQSDGSVAGLARGSGGVSGFGQAIDTGNLALQVESTSLLAPEVSNLMLQYFDGVDWIAEWDSSTLNRMPQAIRIELTLRAAPSGTDTANEDQPETRYWQVVPVPVATPYTEETAL